jgi:hypothetical protein
MLRDVVGLRGVDSGQLFAVTALYPFVVDEEACWLSVFLAIGGSEFD